MEAGIPRMMLLWVIGASLASGLRLSMIAVDRVTAPAGILNILSYYLVVAAPVGGIFLALRTFPMGMLFAQPEMRFARIGRWREVDVVTARSLPLFGASGFMASLIVGMFLNVPVRTLEFLTAIPIAPDNAPGWFLVLRQSMLADLVVMSSLYCFAAIMAMRHVPLFPRFLAVVWGIDVLMQILIARTMGAVPDLPPAVAESLRTLLEGNLKKALISIAIWLPYLLLSKRVNLTYRLRVPG